MQFTSTTKLARAIRNRQISAEEAVDACLKRIAAINPKLNAVVQIAGKEAREKARQADAALARGEVLGPLHGVPMTLKDSFDAAGIISTGGTLGRKSFIPREDATVLKRLKAAGAILLGKTNTPELTLSFETDNLVYGRTRNPHNLGYSPGGSSGGAAASVAAGAVPFDIGSDYGGSLRYPAHCCGIATIKPTSGRVPRTGHILPCGGVLDSFQQIGPLARQVEDLALLMSLIAGPDWRDPAIVPMPLGHPDDVELKALRIAFHGDNGLITPTPEITRAVLNAAELLQGHGLCVEEIRPDGLQQGYDIMMGLLAADGGESVRRLLDQAGTREHTLHWLDKAQPLPPAEFAALMDRWTAFRSDMLRFMRNYDVILCPVNACPALPHGAIRGDLLAFSYTMAFNLTGWPAAVIRGGTAAGGLPLGLQIAARPWREDVALAVAGFLEQRLGGCQPGPDITFHPPS